MDALCQFKFGWNSRCIGFVEEDKNVKSLKKQLPQTVEHWQTTDEFWTES